MRSLHVGHCTLDHYALVDRFSDRGNYVEIDQFSVQGGGSAANASVALSRWGFNPRFVGKVGSDEHGQLIRAGLSEEGVDAQHVVEEYGAESPLAFIFRHTRSEAFQCYGTPGSVTPLATKEVDEIIFEQIDVLHVDATLPALQRDLIKKLQAKTQAEEAFAIPVILSAHAGRRDGLNALIETSDAVICSERVASDLMGVGNLPEMCEALLERGPRAVFVTLGADGCVAMAKLPQGLREVSGSNVHRIHQVAEQSDGSLYRLEGIPIDAVDTSGAGDTFTAAVVFGLMQGWELKRIAQFANRAAALSCRKLGARAGIPSAMEVMS